MAQFHAVLGEEQMFKWVFGFIVVAIVAAISAFSFGIPAAITLALVSLVLGLLLLASSLFEKTASA
jgi:hypothetical protein